MELLDQIREAGVVGAGGAGFPTHVKLNCQVQYLLVNAAECEPLLATDKYIMRSYAREIVQAVEAVGKLLSAQEAYIAVKQVNTEEYASIEKVLTEMNSTVKLFPLENYYPAGDEQMIVCDITGQPVPPGGLPLDVGAVVSNVATMLNIYDAMQGLPVKHKYLTVSGNVKNPTILKAPIGIPFAECVEACGGAVNGEYLIVSGGPMMGQVSNADELDCLYVTKTTSGILLLPSEGNFLARVNNTPVSRMQNHAKSACIQCSFCTDLCPRYLAGHQLRPHMVMRQMAMLDFTDPLPANPILEEALLCCDCGVCEAYACPMGLSPRQINKYVKAGLAGKRPKKNGEDLKTHPMREYRKIAPKKILARMGLGTYYGNKITQFRELDTRKVRIPIKQHIGVPAESVVSVGDKVVEGQLIARIPEGKLAANIHASMTGTVIECDTKIVILGGSR